MAEIKGQLNVNKAQLINLLGSKMYRGDTCSVAVKELLQNAFDACKIARAMEGLQNPAIDISIDTSARVITVTDNGVGMTPEIVQKAFFTIGGSYKGDVPNHLKSGGLGLAKMAFLFSSEWIKVRTVRNGTLTTVETNPAEIQSDNFVIRTEPTDNPNGTVVQVKIPEYYIDESGKENWIYMDSDPKVLREGIIDKNLRITVNGRDRSAQPVPAGYALLGVAKSDFGAIEIFVRPHKSNYTLYADVYNSGLYQFYKGFNLDDKPRIDVKLNILPSVDTMSRIYPINNQREGFNVSVDPEVEDLKFLLNKLNKLVTKRSVREMFQNKISSSVKSVCETSMVSDPEAVLNESIRAIQNAFAAPEYTTSDAFENVIFLNTVHTVREAERRKSSLDLSDIDLSALEVAPVDLTNLDPYRAVMHNNTDLTFSDECAKFLDALGEHMLKLKCMLVETYPEEPRFCRTQYWGLSFDTRYLGIRVSPAVFNFIGINPFCKLKVHPNSNPIDARVEAIVHEIAHELTHNVEGNHYAPFCSELMTTTTLICGLGVNYWNWRNQLRQLVTDNIMLVTEYAERFLRASNVADGFDIDSWYKRRCKRMNKMLELQLDLDLNAPKPSDQIKDGWYADLHINACGEDYADACLRIMQKTTGKCVSMLTVSLFGQSNPFLCPHTAEELFTTALAMIAAIKGNPKELDRMEAYQDRFIP